MKQVYRSGQFAKSIKMRGSCWTKDGDHIRAGSLEDSDAPALTGTFQTSNKDFIRAVRSMK
ncbi:MAG: hypothetical protein DSY58_07885 [Desulfobulbus sp.]|nr:MAG: hypothetical protein DSY58_07885 [Desulfobulbus sp.]RUM41954.1 MAG: hypothetical protein DSY70_00295 [Desulfobulbus sp.]